MPVNPDIIFILLYFQKKVYRQAETTQQTAKSAVWSFCGYRVRDVL